MRKNEKKYNFIVKKNNKGITLIALVVTIIILLILAGVTIGILTGNSGIIGNANNAKEKAEISDLREQIELAIIQAEGKYQNTTLDNVIEELINENIIVDVNDVNKETGAITTKNPKYVIEGMLDDYIVKPVEPAIPGKIVTGENRPYEKNGKAIIPVGWAIVPGLDDISQGLVISDIEYDTENLGNQFVWIPVTVENEFIRRVGYYLRNLRYRQF